MRQRLLCGGLMTLAVVAATTGSEFPLQFKAVGIRELGMLPGNFGTGASLSPAKPARLQTEPRAVSARPLYGQLTGALHASGLLIRLDESRGTGKGYDRLILDLNANGSLSDDPVFSPGEWPGTRPGAPTGYQVEAFGPVPAPAALQQGDWRQVCYAQMYVRTQELGARTGFAAERAFVGSLRLQAGWFAEATVTVGGVTQKFGIIDGNANFRLGDEARSQSYRDGASGEENWSFGFGDNWLRDVDKSGRFEHRVIEVEYEPFGSTVYFGAAPYRVELGADGRTIVVNEWTGPLGELEFRSEGATVRSVLLAREEAGNWQVFRPGLANGRARVPVGQYRLYACDVVGTAANREPVAAGGFLRVMKEPVTVSPNATTTIACGGPLIAKLSTARRPTGSDVVLLQAAVAGAAGETFGSFGMGKSLSGRPPAPSFTLTTKAGKRVASGNMEYG